MRTTIDTGKASAELRRVASRLKNPAPFVKSWTQSAVRQSQANARTKGGKNFWREFARSIHIGEISAESASLINDHVAAAQKQYGGVIRAKNKKALTIPVSKEARGKSAGEFHLGGRMIFIPKDDSDTKGLLGYKDGVGDFHPLFVLRTKTKRQEPDEWLPADRELTAMGMREAWFWLEKELKRP